MLEQNNWVWGSAERSEKSFRNRRHYRWKDKIETRIEWGEGEPQQPGSDFQNEQSGDRKSPRERKWELGWDI